MFSTEPPETTPSDIQTILRNTLLVLQKELDQNQEGLGVLDRSTKIFEVVNSQVMPGKEVGKESQRYFPLKKQNLT